MKICILGWYGTETLGDRAILAGIFRIFSHVTLNSVFAIGSLYEFYTERTLYEEKKYYDSLVNDGFYYCFDVKNKKRLKSEIESSDIVIMGGGPLMNMYELELIYEGFKYAHKMEKKTILMGCGVESLNKFYANLVKRIYMVTDCIILRDEISKMQLEKICGKSKKVFVCADPAILGINIKVQCLNEKNYAVVNIRDCSFRYRGDKYKEIEEFLCRELSKLAQMYEKVYLLPNHTFVLGGDDRIVNYRISSKINCSKIEVLEKPLNLQETFSYIKNADVCIGMRYHAIMFQTILNGNNYILDYTDDKVGKIVGFLDFFKCMDFYSDRYVNLGNIDNYTFKKYDQGERFCYDASYEDKIIKSYLRILIKERIIDG